MTDEEKAAIAAMTEDEFRRLLNGGIVEILGGGDGSESLAAAIHVARRQDAADPSDGA